MFANQTTEQVTIGDVTVTIRKLSWRSLRNAAEKAAEHGALMTSVFTKAGVLTPQSIKDAEDKADKKKSKTPEEKRLERYKTYERGSILVAGVKTWTLPEKVTKETLDELGEAEAEQLHRAILDLSLPPIEADVEAAERKND